MGGRGGRGRMGLMEKLGCRAVITRAQPTLLIGPLKDVLCGSEGAGHSHSCINQALDADCLAK